MMIYHTNGPKLLDLIYRDCLAMLPTHNQEIMTRSLRNSPDAWVAYHDEMVLGFCGLIPPTLLSDTAYLWMFTTPGFAEHRTACLRQSRKLLQDALQRYPIIVGHCSMVSQRWLQWLGATLLPPQGDFIPFEIKAK